VFRGTDFGPHLSGGEWRRILTSVTCGNADAARDRANGDDEYDWYRWVDQTVGSIDMTIKFRYLGIFQRRSWTAAVLADDGR